MTDYIAVLLAQQEEQEQGICVNPGDSVSEDDVLMKIG